MSSNSNTPVNKNTNQFGFNEDIQVTFAGKQITLSTKFIETVTNKIKQTKLEASQEPDPEKKQMHIKKAQNIERMLQDSLTDYKKKVQELKNMLQNQQPISTNNNQQANTNTNTETNANTNQNSGGVSLKTFLNEEQKIKYNSINAQFQTKTAQLAQAFEQNKKQLEMVIERLKTVIPETEKKEYDDLMARKLKAEQAGKSYQNHYKNLEAQIQEYKKRFYLTASESNAELKNEMMKFPQFQAYFAQKSATADAANKAAVAQTQPQIKSTPITKQDSSNNIPKSASAVKQTPQPKANTGNNPNTPSNTVPTQGILKSTVSENTLLADAPKSVKPVEVPKTDFQKDPTQPTIFGGYLGSNPILSQPLNRVLGVNDNEMSNTTQQTQTTTHRKNVYVPTPQDHVLTKRKLRDLLKQYNGPSANIDGDVEELLLDLSDNFITQVVKFGGKVAKLRKSENLEVKDIKFALKKGFDLDL